MQEMRTVYAMAPNQMDDWNNICKAFAKKHNAELIFVNETSCGIQTPDGQLHHIYIDEMAEMLKTEEKET